jgi:siroheme synthase (precorrin-2 oxidase/ferrochelatase)
VSQIHRGPLTVTVSSAGTAPALTARLRRRLETELEPELCDLAGAIGRARTAHGPPEVPFDEWTTRWATALADLDGLVALLRKGDSDAVEAHILAALRDG